MPTLSTKSRQGQSNPREVELGDDVINIEWRVHLANRKASFFSFYGQVGADDLYIKRSGMDPNQQIKIQGDDPPRVNLRNANVPAAGRAAKLEIDPGEQLVSKDKSGPLELTNTNSEIPIRSLGTLSVEQSGRLIVLGGYGESNSSQNPPVEIDEYANNDAWFDDTSDGSVKARIILKDGSTFDADPAWVLVGPPDFAPGIGNVVSLFDTLWDTAVREVDFPQTVPLTPMWRLLKEQKQVWQTNGEKSIAGFKPSFTRDIYPILKRALGARDVHVSGRYANPNYHKRLLGNMAILSALSGENADIGTKCRKGVLDIMRNPDDQVAAWDKMPRGLGDDYTQVSNDPTHPSARSFLSLTRIQYAMLTEWANGNFVDDWPGTEPTMSPKQNPTPDDLDCASVENCVGGPFYPGIEVSWLIRAKDLFSEPFRLKTSSQPNDPSGAFSPPFTIGALTFRPGFFSQQMALPWQADFYDCHKEQWYDPNKAEYFFMWWTAQRPDDVFPSKSAQQVRWVRIFDDPNKSLDENENDLTRFKQMQSRWFELKFVSVFNVDHYEEEP